MASIYLTPASIGYLTQFILSLAITIFFIIRLRQRTPQLVLLTVFFILVTLFIALLFLDAVSLPFTRLLAVYAQNTVLAAALVFLIQFAYHFPQKFPKHHWIAQASLLVSGFYFFIEASYMVSRYFSLLLREMVYYRPLFLDYCNALVILLVPVAFVLQCLASDPHRMCWFKKLLKPQGKPARGARVFVFNFGILFYLGITNILRACNVFSTGVYNASLSIGVLVALWLFTSNYINFIPGGVSVQAKLSILPLTLFLAILGSVSWVISPSYIVTFTPNLSNHQTLRFTPNTTGGYDVAEVPFTFERTLGERAFVQPTNENRNSKVRYPFTFFNRDYNNLYVSSSGAISMGTPLWQPNLQAQFARLPVIFPLMIELDPTGSGGLYVWQDAASQRLVVTWHRLPARYYRDAVFTFQVILYSNGVFDITYDELPLPFVFSADETPSANPWLRGALAGSGESLHTGSCQNLQECSQTGQILLQNFQLEFRQYLHRYMLPMLWFVIGGSIVMILLFPWLLKTSIIRPLNSLMAGIHAIDQGDLEVSIPVSNEDELGVLTQHFNKMTARLNELVTGLEQRVAERTLQLSHANQRLRKRLKEINQLQAELKEQSIRDPLTDAFNRRYLMEMLDMEISRAKREKKPISLVMLDVDCFKDFNDHYRHQAGDFILQELVKLIRSHTRKEDLVCRYGGDEFIVLLPKASSADAKKWAEELRLACEQMHVVFNDQPIAITISLGIVGSHYVDQTAEELLKLADDALYTAKDSGRNCIYLADVS